MTVLRWERQTSGAWYGYSGDIVAAMVVERVGGRWAWTVEGGRKPYGWQNYGERKTASSGKRAADDYWRRWLDHAGLQPKATP